MFEVKTSSFFPIPGFERPSPTFSFDATGGSGSSASQNVWLVIDCKCRRPDSRRVVAHRKQVRKPCVEYFKGCQPRSRGFICAPMCRWD